jgi:hypothetical protein
MATSRPPTRSNARLSRPISKRKPIREKQGCRKSTLIKKTREYSKMCDTDICLGIRFRETGEVYLVSAGASTFWAFLSSQLVCRHALAGFSKRTGQDSHYPTSIKITDRDLENTGENTTVAGKRTTS